MDKGKRKYYVFNQNLGIGYNKYLIEQDADFMRKKYSFITVSRRKKT
jgi:hypothetical protein